MYLQKLEGRHNMNANATKTNANFETLKTATEAVQNATTTVKELITLTPGTAPAEPAEGMIYADAATHTLRFYNGTAWQSIDMTVV